MTWIELPFGRHMGKTLPQVLFSDPGWFFWAHAGHVFRGLLVYEAERIHRRATHIAIPDQYGGQFLVEYVLQPAGRKLSSVQVVPISLYANPVQAVATRSSSIDLSMAWQLSPFDKAGGKLLVDKVKEIHFGSTSFRMTRERCAEFFDEDANFLLKEQPIDLTHGGPCPQRDPSAPSPPIRSP